MIDDEVVGEGASKGATKAMNVEVPYYIGGIPPEIAADVRTNIKVSLSKNSSAEHIHAFLYISLCA